MFQQVSKIWDHALVWTQPCINYILCHCIWATSMHVTDLCIILCLRLCYIPSSFWMLTICISDPLLQKQFRKQNVWREPEQNNEGSSQRSDFAFIDEAPASVPDGSQNELASQYQHEQSSADEKRKSVHEWIRVPVSYDDLLGDDLKNEAWFLNAGTNLGSNFALGCVGIQKYPLRLWQDRFLVFERKVCIGCPFLTCNCVLLEHRMSSLLPQLKKNYLILLLWMHFLLPFIL